jgi:hypothetical protein
MKLVFKDKSYIEINKNNIDKIVISIGAKDTKNALSMLVNSVEISIEDWEKIIKIES